MTTLKYSILLIFVSFVATGCKDDEDTTASISPSMEVLVDDERQVVTSVEVDKHSEKKYGETIRTCDIYTKVNEFNFKISIKNWSWQGLPARGPKAKAYYPSDENKRECHYDENSNLMCEMTTVIYYRSLDTFYLTPLYEYQENFVGITRNENGTIDGNFDVVCKTTRDDKVHLKGSFNKLRL